MLVPDPEKEQEDFIIEKADSGQLTVDNYDYQQGDNTSQQSNHNFPLSTVNSPLKEDSTLEDDFDLSDITHKEKSREDIIAEAEAQAFAEA